jgi:hypothetical protein
MALRSWRERRLSEFEPESAEEPEGGADEELVNRARNLNELRLLGVIGDRELVDEREEIRRELLLSPGRRVPPEPLPD